MDSRLLNMVYDDPFDGNYVKYDNDTEFWASGSGIMGMQLAETLNGILPIAPTDDFHKDEQSNTINIQNSKNALNYEDCAGQHLGTSGAIEIVTIDPNTEGYDTDSEDEEYSDDDDDNNGINNNLLHYDRQSMCSNDTFRTRTDSSSIGDYESHTSDYDDDDDDDDNGDNNNGVDNYFNDDNISVNKFNLLKNDLSSVDYSGSTSILDLPKHLIASDDLFLDNSFSKTRTLSTNTLNSDIDGLGLQIDANNFDLAEFITKDDFQLNHIASETNIVKNTTPTYTGQVPSILQTCTSKSNNFDSDSDVIVDVETVEVDEDEAISLRASDILKTSSVQHTPLQTEEEPPFVDNVKSDPSWIPNSTSKKVDNNNKVEETNTTQKPNFSHNFSLVPNKKQSDLLKGKFAKGKGKTSQKSLKITSKNMKTQNCPLKLTSAVTTVTKSENSLKQIGIGMGGKNLSLLRHEHGSTSEQSSEDNNTPQKNGICHNSSEELTSATANKKIENLTQNNQAVKRKLNLEEYKMRRGSEPIAATSKTQSNDQFLPYKIPKLECKINSTQANKNKNQAIHNTSTKHSEVVTSIVKSLKNQQSLVGKIALDPITEAKNKVLRMQELKRAQQMRIIDSTISAKVPRVTKLLPLKEIVKATPFISDIESKSINSQTARSEYEEIIIVSASCNTEISIPPDSAIQPVNKATRSLLKSSALLYTITNSFQKVKATDHTKLSTSSLIASIQDVVVKKTLPIEETVTGKEIKDAKKSEHHGEDKIIMHLRKDRIRKRMCSIGIQTDLQPEFPPLPLPKSCILHKSRERIRGHRKRQYRKQDSSFSSETSSDEHSDNSNASSMLQSRDNSCSSSLERIRTYDSAIGTGGYSSRSSFKHRSSISSSYSESADHMGRSRRQRRTSYTKRSAARKLSRSPYSSSSYTSDSDGSRSPCYKRSRSRSNSRERLRSRRFSYRKGQNRGNNCVNRNVSQPAVEERRIVYVGRIEQETTKDMLRRKFLQYGTIKQISIHFKDTGMKYGFVTFERSDDAFAAIDNSTRDPKINMYDISFGGRRAFCRASYADLDNAGINTYQSYVFPQPVQPPKEDDSFEALLMKMKEKLNANKTNDATSTKGEKNANNKI